MRQFLVPARDEQTNFIVVDNDNLGVEILEGGER